jgi:hypothetical protein
MFGMKPHDRILNSLSNGYYFLYIYTNFYIYIYKAVAYDPQRDYFGNSGFDSQGYVPRIENL